MGFLDKAKAALQDLDVDKAKAAFKELDFGGDKPKSDDTTAPSVASTSTSTAAPTPASSIAPKEKSSVKLPLAIRKEGKFDPRSGRISSWLTESSPRQLGEQDPRTRSKLDPDPWAAMDNRYRRRADVPRRSGYRSDSKKSQGKTWRDPEQVRNSLASIEYTY